MYEKTICFFYAQASLSCFCREYDNCTYEMICMALSTIEMPSEVRMPALLMLAGANRYGEYVHRGFSFQRSAEIVASIANSSRIEAAARTCRSGGSIGENYIFANCNQCENRVFTSYYKLNFGHLVKYFLHFYFY